MSERTTISLPRALARRLALTARATGRSASAIVREALEAHLAGQPAYGLPPFVGIGDSGREDTAERAEELIAERFGRRKRRI